MVNVVYNVSAVAGNIKIMRPAKQINAFKKVENKAEVISNNIVVKPFNYLNCAMKHTLYISNVIFCDIFCIDSAVMNENIIIENCTFNKRVALKQFKNSKLIIRNCTFNEELSISDVTTESLELFGTTHHNDVQLNSVNTDLYFTGSIRMVSDHLLFLNDCCIRNYMKH